MFNVAEEQFAYWVMTMEYILFDPFASVALDLPEVYLPEGMKFWWWTQVFWVVNQ
jgi:hypothetical protein